MEDKKNQLGSVLPSKNEVVPNSPRPQEGVLALQCSAMGVILEF